MKRNGHRANVASAVLIAVVLVACSISGLAAGVYARHLGDSLVAGTGTATVSSHSPPSAPTATPAPAVTATTTIQPAENVLFILSASASPRTLASGQNFTITVAAVTRDSGQVPVAGLQCFMRAPTDGRAPLFQDWPTPVTTGADGQATWNLTTPQVSPGTYGVEVVAYGPNSYSYHFDTFVTISG